MIKIPNFLKIPIGTYLKHLVKCTIMYDMVKIDIIVFEIASCLKHPGSDWVKCEL